MAEDVLESPGFAGSERLGPGARWLVEQGPSGVPTLVTALGSDRVEVRRLAMEGLGTVADPGTADDVRAGLDDSDGQVRSLAAVALARMNDPAALDALADTLDDWPDLLHSEMSRSAYSYPASAYGLSGSDTAAQVPPTAADRAKGDWVIRAVLRHTGDDHDTNDLSQIMQDFTPDADADQRQAAAARAADCAPFERSAGPLMILDRR